MQERRPKRSSEINISICIRINIRKIPNVEFQKNGETWVLDVRFTKPHNEEESFASKIDKY